MCCVSNSTAQWNPCDNAFFFNVDHIYLATKRCCIRSEDATYKLLDEKTPLSFTGDLYGSLPINCVDYVGKPSCMPAQKLRFHAACFSYPPVLSAKGSAKVGVYTFIVPQAHV